MGMIKFTQRGSFRNTERYLARLKTLRIEEILNKYGSMGVNALSAATPVDTGETAQSWSYSIVNRPGYCSLRFHNSHQVNGVPVAVLVQYGHGTGTGGYVQGRDFINPAIKPIFDKIAVDLREEVTKI